MWQGQPRTPWRRGLLWRSRRSNAGILTHHQIRRLLQAVSAHCPFAISVHIGENDLSHIPDGQITYELLDFIHRLSRLCSSDIVIFSQLISFPQTWHEHRSSVRRINADLCRAIPSRHVFWRHQCGLISTIRSLRKLALSIHRMIVKPQTSPVWW